jgi:uncharacterized repeat protein (TIGR03803 family)
MIWGNGAAFVARNFIRALFGGLSLLVALCLSLFCAPASADPNMETVLHYFTGTSGAEPDTTPVLAADGSLYGTASFTTLSNNNLDGGGTVYRVAPDGTFTTIYTFTGFGGDHLWTPSGVSVGSDGYLYGGVGLGAHGYGALYRLSTTGSLTTLYSFNGASDGNFPFSPLIQGADGSLYGAAQRGGANGAGTIFKLSSSGALTVLYTFTGGADGGSPSGSMVLGTDGTLYGTTQKGGAGSAGMVFSLSSGGVFTTRYSFSGAAGSTPVGGVTLGRDGNLYGTTSAGGNGYGTIFQVTPAGVETTLHTFSSAEGQAWAGLMQGADGNWYGTTLGVSNVSYGIVFSMTPGGTVTTLYSMHRYDGEFMRAGLAQDASGNFLGATWKWGDNGAGTVFKIQPSTNPTPPSISLSANPTSGPVGQNTTLSWTSSGASQCVADDGWTGSQPTSGSQAVTIAQSGANTYTLICAGIGAAASQAVSVNGIPPPTVSLSASPGSVYVGQPSKLAWSSSNAQTCTASGAWSGGQPLSGSTTVTINQSGSTTFTLACTGPGGTTTQSASVTATYAPPTVTLTANPTVVGIGQSTTLSWTSTNANSCSALGGWSSSTAASGSQAVTVSGNGANSYSLSCTGQGGTVTQSVTVTGQPMPTVSLTAAPSSVTVGGSANLNWSSTNASSCAASGAWSGSVSISGSQTVVINQSGANNFMLTCSSNVGSASQTVTVTGVPPAPTLALSATPSSVLIGQASTLSWSASNASSCTASGAWSGSTATSGSQSVTVSKAGTNSYTLTCTGSGGSTAQTVTVTGTLPAVGFQAAAETATANRQKAVSVSIPLTLSNAINYQVTVPYSLGGTEPSSGYSVSPNGSVVIPAGATSATLTVNVNYAQCNKTIVLTLGTPSNATLGSTSVNTLTLKTAVSCN